MKKLKSFLAILLISFELNAQISSPPIYGIVRKNYYSTVVDPMDSTMTYQQFDSATIRLGTVNPLLGFVSNMSNTTYNQAVNLTGAALNPYANTYIFLGGYGINTFDLNTGNIINQVQMTNPLGQSYFDNFRFNNSDSTIYGLSRRSYFNPSTNSNQFGVFLAKANSQTGLITEISTNALAAGFSMSGSAIDPYQMVYYFAVGNNLIGVDMYTGSVYSNVVMTMTDGFAFGNFTYSCADTALYGLVRQNYFSYIPDPTMPGDSIEVLDSATVKLGRVNPSTGVVTNISSSTLLQGGFTINGGAAIDPVNMVYFYSTGAAIVGASLNSGLVTSNSIYTFSNGDYFDLMRNTENCLSSVVVRPNPLTTGIKEQNGSAYFDMYPNPVTDALTINGSSPIKELSISHIDGKIIQTQKVKEGQNIFDLSHLSPGLYFVKLTTTDNRSFTKKIFRQ